MDIHIDDIDMTTQVYFVWTKKMHTILQTGAWWTVLSHYLCFCGLI